MTLNINIHLFSCLSKVLKITLSASWRRPACAVVVLTEVHTHSLEEYKIWRSQLLLGRFCTTQ